MRLLLLHGDGCILDYTFYFLVARCRHWYYWQNIIVVFHFCDYNNFFFFFFSNKHDSYLYYTYGWFYTRLNFIFVESVTVRGIAGIFCVPVQSLSCVFHIECSVT